MDSAVDNAYSRTREIGGDTSEAFTLGTLELDSILGDALVPGSLLVVAGHPGSGKTTLASTICYANAQRGKKCLYVSFQEHKEKLYSNMKKLGLNLEELEKQGLLFFVKLPLLAKGDAVDSVLSTISESVIKYNPGIVVVDSITPLLKATENDVSARAVLQNFFAELPQLLKGLVVLLAEVPLGLESTKLGDIEFVADVVLILKHKVVQGLLTRYMELRKARGANISVAELPFTITEGKGLVVYGPVVLEEIPAAGTEFIEPPCRVFREVVGSIKRGEVIYMTYPPDARPTKTLAFLVATAAVNGLKVLFISYKSSPRDLRALAKRELVELGVNEEVAEKLVDQYFVFRGINPLGVSLSQLSLLETKIIEEHNPDVVVFHGVDIPAALIETSTWRAGLLNELLYLRKRGVTTIRMGSYDDKYWFNASLADVVVKVSVREVERNGEKSFEYESYVWRRGMDKPLLIGERALVECIAEVREIVKRVHPVAEPAEKAV